MMLLFRIVFAGGGLRPAAFVALVLGGSGILFGCASTESTTLTPAASPGTGPTAADAFFGSSASPSGGLHPTKTDIPTDYFLQTGYCPPIEVKPGTEVFATYDRGHDADPASLKTQASISKMARECHWTGDTLTVKVGVAGRIVAGPKGAAGTVTLPIRIAVVRQPGATPLYSQLFKTPVALNAPDFSADYSQVFDQVTVQTSPTDKDYLIYVGFDEGKPKPKS